jgi:hypothetical protein
MGMYLDSPAKPIMVGDTESFISQLGCPLHEVARPRCAIEERVVGVTMQLGVTVHASILVEHMFDQYE